jgi:processive 1,2-diacylglycerol beta-glucosyltransferase
MKRLLVLTSATGAGHDTHALATAAWCRRLYGDEIEVTIAHALEDSHALYRHGVAFYNLIQRRAPWFHHIYYNVVELLEVLNPGTVSLGRASYVHLLERTRPDAILSVHDCLNRGYFELAREVLGPKVKRGTYCTEFEGGYGFSRNWVNPQGDFLFARTPEVAREALRRGMAPGGTSVAGHWAPPPFYTADEADIHEIATLRQKWGLEPNRFTLLLSTGGAAAQNHRAMLRTLAPLSERIQIIALCGRDERAHTDLETWATRESPLTVRFLSFTDRMPELLRASSAVVARAGATTAGEALLCRCPVIFNGLGGMMPQELPTWRYFRSRGIGSAALTAGAIRDQVTKWLDDPAAFASLRERLRHTRDGTTPQVALEMLLEM